MLSQLHIDISHNVILWVYKKTDGKIWKMSIFEQFKTNYKRLQFLWDFSEGYLYLFILVKWAELSEIRGSHDSENVNNGFLGCNTVNL
jgi:hypothetical protein